MTTTSQSKSFRYNDYKPIPQYNSRKKVWALEIGTVGNVYGYGDIGVTYANKDFNPFYIDDLSVLERYMPKRGDFHVWYEDGGYAFVPRASFLKGYERA